MKETEPIISGHLVPYRVLGIFRMGGREQLIWAPADGSKDEKLMGIMAVAVIEARELCLRTGMNPNDIDFGLLEKKSA